MSAIDAAETLHDRALVVDLHIDSLQHALLAGADLSRRTGIGQVDLPRLADGGVDAPFFAAWVDPIFEGRAAFDRASALLDCFDDLCQRSDGALVACRSPEDALAAKAAGRVAGLVGVEGGHAIADDLGCLETLAARGVRYMTLCHGASHSWCDSSTDEPRHGGITDFGREVISAMERLGVVVDLAHVSEDAFFQTLEAAEKPVFDTHACCTAVADHKRNVTDAQMEALAANGGVLGITFVADFVDAAFNEACSQVSTLAELLAGLEAKYGDDLEARAVAAYRAFLEPPPDCPPLPTLERVLDHIDHALRVMGDEHVALGSDFDGTNCFPKGLGDAALMGAVTRGLLGRGHSADVVEGVLGLNALRVLV